MTLTLLFGILSSGILVILVVFKFLDLQKAKRSINSLNKIISNIKTSNRQEIIKKINAIRTDYSDLTLVNFANRYSWSSLIISCLPRLYFIKGNNASALIWREALNLIPKNISINVIKKYCRGELIEISMNKHAKEIIDEIANRLENARTSNPYPSYSALIGVINQFINDFELELQTKQNVNLANEMAKERKQLLAEELNVSIFPKN